MKTPLEKLIQEQKMLQGRLRIIEEQLSELEQSQKSEERRKKEDWNKKVIKYLNDTHELGSRLSFLQNKLSGFKTPKSPMVESVEFNFPDPESIYLEIFPYAREPYDSYFNMYDVGFDHWQEWGKAFQVPDVLTVHRMMSHIAQLAGNENERDLALTLKELGFEIN